MNELRREVLTTATPRRAERRPEVLASRQASLAAPLLDPAEHHEVLDDASRQEGIPSEIRTAALDAAGKLGTVLQQLRDRKDLEAALAQAPGYPPRH